LQHDKTRFGGFFVSVVSIKIPKKAVDFLFVI